CSFAPTARPTGGFRADYGFVGILDAEIRRDPDREIGYGITDIWEDPDEIVEEIPTTDVAELDRRIHARTARLMESEARASREAWIQLMNASDTTRSEVSAPQTTVLAQQTEIGDLRAADRRRQTQLIEALTLLRTLQTQMAALQSQQRPAGDPAHLDVPKEKMPPRKAPKTRTTRSSPATTTTITTPVTDTQLKVLLDQGVVDALAARDADRSRNSEDSHDSGTGDCWSRCCVCNDLDKPKKIKTDKCCPRGEIKKLEVEMWNLKVKGTDVVNYNQRFQELALMCSRMFPEESDKIERYVGSLPDMIHGNVMASKPTTIQDAIEFAAELMDKKIRTFAERQSENKRKQDDNQQQQNKRQNTGKAYTAGSGQKATCFECGAQGYFKRECPKLKNNNRGNQGADRRFMSTAFSSKIDITPTTLDHYYDVELADRRIIGLNTI
ncbi:reverse transcriptase domain-containing protein, partial [Tanacetum coccineum]